MTREEVDRWLAGYVSAWKSYDPEAIGALFSEDVAYRYHPYDSPCGDGRRSSRRGWARGSTPTPPSATRRGPTTASYQAVAVDGDVAVATGASLYSEEPGGPVVQAWDNCFVMRFDSEGRCREFTEWFAERPSP